MSEPIEIIAPPPPGPITPMLARALAEAADGLAESETGPFFLLALYQRSSKPGLLFDIHPFYKWSDVSPMLRDEVADHKRGWFGPYAPEPTPAPTGVPVADVWVCSKKKVWYRLGSEFDALFYTRAAVEKFAQPYYEALYGAEFAEEVMEQFLAADLQVMAHYPWSEYDDKFTPEGLPAVLVAGKHEHEHEPGGQRLHWNIVQPRGQTAHVDLGTVRRRESPEHAAIEVPEPFAAR
ncbi:hypothetical protein [Longimicrobium sp.]|uniref:hypothetical protein n=1 Tax=Longimicrobium sp. TaxID=2029185 RepID=UPI002E322850|nr:hypothetical protein [Longimicrobium sp.]HEX6038077.1 hypothetical protein [Longimicrobium sp.]